MAMTYQNFASLGVNLNRQKYGPLDISNVFTSAADLKYYLTKGTFTEGVSEYWYKNANEKIVPYPYEGQVLATVIDGVVSVYALSLDADGNFQTQEIGAKVEVDGTTIVKDANGKLSIVAPVNPDSSKTYNFAYANGVYSWVEVDTATAAGQAQAIAGLTDRTVALETAINGKAESEEGAGDAVVGLVDKVAALEAVDNATQAELDAYKTEVTTAIGEALQAAKDYADQNDADTVYDDTALAARVKALEDEERYDETALANRVTANEEAIDDLVDAIGDENGGLTKAIADEKARAEEAEADLLEKINKIDFVDPDELAEAIKDFATEAELTDGLALKADKSDFDDLKGRVDTFFTGTGVENVIDTLEDLVNYINTHEEVDIPAITADIQALEDKLAGIDSTVAAYVTATIDALKIGDYAKAADLTTLAGRVGALEAKPFDTYATKTEVQNIDAKFANYTTTETLTAQLADKADADKVVSNDTFETFKSANTTAIEAAQGAAVAAAKTETETQVGALEDTVAETYATKDELGEAVEGIENDLLAYAKTDDVEADLAKKIETATIAHSSESLAEGVTVEGTKLNIVVDTYTKQEVRDYVADVIEDMTGGESAADVLLALNNHIDTYTEKVGQIDAKDAAQDTAITKAQGDATKGIEDAAKVAADLATANTAISKNAGDIAVVSGNLTSVNENLTAEITALKQADNKFTGDIATLTGIVSGDNGHEARITAVEGRATALEAKDTALATLIQANTDKFADYYTKTDVDAVVITSGEVARGEADSVTIANNKITVTVDAYTKAQTDSKIAEEIGKIDNTAITNNTADIVVLVGDDKNDVGRANKSIREIAAEEAKAEVAILVGQAPEALDTIHEIASWIESDTTGAAAMSAEIAEHSAILSGFGGENQPATVVSAIATAKAEAIAAATYTLEVATAEKLGGVKSATGDNKVTVDNAGVMSVATVNVNTLTQTTGDVLILNGGSAAD